ncbi:TIGR04282 family arsenosugar biosynthesis glycosyltransferase [uncultured Roseobacter sp.]|uniref:TIGR04282 family arsenosugar biosynthesis glycosyltransferase n=1 Tax=uncultured Roseobacter sp. TaxID=114847 RepID=UPI00260F6237|nr:TIGR04282 family arsenosugar biosynthesis glycosyltransferase [uncultured Roseobacter sp.]
MKPTLVVMLKEPHPGRVKTRLGKDIGMVAAAWWFRHQTRHLISRVQDPRWRVILAVSPDAEGLRSRVWPAHLGRMPQGRGDLGDRMKRALSLPTAGPVCIIGSDIPDIDRKQIARAFRALGPSDAVFGPAPDGGYWLIGLKRMQGVSPRLFEGVRWSSEHALADTAASLPTNRIAYVDRLRDVDTLDDLRMTAPGAHVT